MAPPPPAADPGRYAGQVLLLSTRLLDDASAAPGFVAFDPIDAGRPVGDDLIASGWELYVGDESDAELEDLDNARLADVEGALERFPQLQVLFDEHDTSAEGAWLATGDGDWLEIDEDDLDAAEQG
jgi:hypothetical protein